MRGAAIVLACAVVGAVAGAVWEAVWTPPAGVSLDGAFVLTDGLPTAFGGTGTFVLVGAVAGLLLGVGGALASDHHEVVGLLALAVGSVVATWVMLRTGQALGPPDADALARRLEDLDPLVGDLHVDGRSPLVVLPTATLLGATAVFLGLGHRRTRDHAGTAPAAPPQQGAEAPDGGPSRG